MEEGVKDRPCAIVLVLLREGDIPIVRVLPITHSAPSEPADALEIPLLTKQRLDWIRTLVDHADEANDFIWPRRTCARQLMATLPVLLMECCRQD